MKLSQGQKSHSCQIAVKPLYFADFEAKKKPPKHSENGLSKRFLNGARDGTRTHDLLITNQSRYQLRHSTIFGCCGSAVFGGAAPCAEIYRSPRRIRFVYRKLPLPPGVPRHTSETKAPYTRYRRAGIIPTSQRSSIKPLS